MGSNHERVADARAGLERVKVEVSTMSFDHMDEDDRKFLEHGRTYLLRKLNETTRLVLCLAIDIHDAHAGGIKNATKEGGG